MASRGSLTVGGSSISLGVVTHEEADLQTGLIDFSFPLLNSTNSVGSNLKGRRRVITIEGAYAGVMTDIEAVFLRGIDGWVNTNGTTAQGHYYPMFHPDNNGGSSQDKYYSVLPESFRYSWDDSQGPAVLRYTLVMVELIKVL